MIDAQAIRDWVTRQVIGRDKPKPAGGPTCERCHVAPAHWPSYCERVYCASCYAIVLAEPVQ